MRQERIKFFSASSYSESLVTLPGDLIESEFNRIGETTDFVKKQKRALIRCELNRRVKLANNVGVQIAAIDDHWWDDHNGLNAKWQIRNWSDEIDEVVDDSLTFVAGEIFDTRIKRETIPAI